MWYVPLVQRTCSLLLMFLLMLPTFTCIQQRHLLLMAQLGLFTCWRIQGPAAILMVSVQRHQIQVASAKQRRQHDLLIFSESGSHLFCQFTDVPSILPKIYFSFLFFFFNQSSILYTSLYTCQSQLPNSAHHNPLPTSVFPPWCPYVCSLHLCLNFCPANRFYFSF